MAREPDQRFESMEALLAAVHRGQRGRRRAHWLGALGMFVAASTGYWRWSRARLAARCNDAARAEVEAWRSDSSRDRVRQALLATAVPYAETSAATALVGPDAHAEAWAEANNWACQ